MHDVLGLNLEIGEGPQERVQIDVVGTKYVLIVQETMQSASQSINQLISENLTAVT